MRVLLTTAASVFFVSFCECCNSPRCWLKISYSRALKPSIHAVLLLFRRGSGSLANVKCHDRCKVSSSSFSVSLCLTCIESPVHAVPRASVVASKSFALLRPLRFMPDSSNTLSWTTQGGGKRVIFPQSRCSQRLEDSAASPILTAPVQVRAAPERSFTHLHRPGILRGWISRVVVSAKGSSPLPISPSADCVLGQDVPTAASQSES